MSIGNQNFGIPRKYQNQIGIWYFCPNFLGIFLVFYRYLENDLLKIWLNIGIFGQKKIGFVFGFSGCHFIGIGLVLVCNFLKMASLLYLHITCTHRQLTGVHYEGARFVIGTLLRGLNGIAQIRTYSSKVRRHEDSHLADCKSTSTYPDADSYELYIRLQRATYVPTQC